MTNYACVKNIVSLEIDVSEKIDKENLKDFAFTSLILNNKNFSKNDLIFEGLIEVSIIKDIFSFTKISFAIFIKSVRFSIHVFFIIYKIAKTLSIQKFY